MGPRLSKLTDVLKDCQYRRQGSQRYPPLPYTQGKLDSYEREHRKLSGRLPQAIYIPLTCNMTDPGLLFVRSRVHNVTMTDQAFNRFYDEEHLGDVLKWEQRFTDLALRYKSINAGDNFPYLALYPVHDCSFFTWGEHQRMANATRKVRFLDGVDILDYVEYEPRQYRRVQTFEGQESTECKARGRARTLICVVIEPAEDDHEEFDKWYRKQHLDMLSMCPGFRRKLLGSARVSAFSGFCVALADQKVTDTTANRRRPQQVIFRRQSTRHGARSYSAGFTRTKEPYTSLSRNRETCQSIYRQALRHVRAFLSG